MSLSLWVMALMISVASAFGYNNSWNSFELGFWLVFLSFVPFLSAFALNEWIQKLGKKKVKFKAR